MSARDRIKVAAAQYPIDHPATVAEWRAKIARWVSEGAATGAGILVFPEYGAIELAATFGPAAAGDLQATLERVADLADNLETTFADLARQHGAHILAPSGPVRRDDGRFANAARLLTPDGRVGVQHKLIMTPFERAWGVAPGETIRVFDTDLGRIGIAICYDCEFPLLVRAQAEAGAEVILVPSCTERLSGYHRVRTAAQARALESQIATVVSPTVGDAPWSPAVDHNVGAAGIYVPAEPLAAMTGVLAEGELNKPGWIAAEIDRESLRQLRAEGEMRNRIDWSLQPGAAPLAHLVEIADLT